MTNIPIYRAKKIDSDEYLFGTGTTDFLNISMMFRIDDKYKNDGSRLWLWSDYSWKEIDPSTLSIHFPDMLASDSDRLLPNGEKDLRIFASLSEDGKGADIVTGKCRDINKDELIGLHKPLAYKGLVRFYKETSMSVVIETHEEIIASTEHWSQPLIARKGEALRWSDCREDMKTIGIKQ